MHNNLRIDELISARDGGSRPCQKSRKDKRIGARVGRMYGKVVRRRMRCIKRGKRDRSFRVGSRKSWPCKCIDQQCWNNKRIFSYR